MPETFRSWLPIEGTEEELFLETVTKGLHHVEATLSRGVDAERTLVVNFGDAIAFRVSPEHAFMQAPQIQERRGNGCLYTVEDSSYREWLESGSLGILNHPFKHFAIVSVDGCLDVLTLDEPVVHWRSEEQNKAE